MLSVFPEPIPELTIYPPLSSGTSISPVLSLILKPGPVEWGMMSNSSLIAASFPGIVDYDPLVPVLIDQ
ncbi:hypothetical protein, partial [Bacteroides uniformis]|uniref:hypothetical protein n=1 Tax=Bacteroides uniformis TaxID=820 RepID=UPI00216AD26C